MPIALMTKETVNTTARPSGKEDDVMADEATRIVRAEMVRRGYSFKQLSEAMNALGNGGNDSVQSLINKVNRGRFSFAFVLRVMRAMDVPSIALTTAESTGARSQTMNGDE